MKSRVCKTCKEEQPMRCYIKNKGYYIWKCNMCRAASAQRNHEAQKNRKFNALVNW